MPYATVQVHDLTFQKLSPAIKGMSYAKTSHDAPCSRAHTGAGRISRRRPDSEIPSHTDRRALLLTDELLVQNECCVTNAVLTGCSVGESASSTEIIHYDRHGETDIVSVANPVAHFENYPIVSVTLRSLAGIPCFMTGTVFIPCMLVGMDIVHDGSQLPLGHRT